MKKLVLALLVGAVVPAVVAEIEEAVETRVTIAIETPEVSVVFNNDDVAAPFIGITQKDQAEAVITPATESAAVAQEAVPAAQQEENVA